MGRKINFTKSGIGVRGLRLMVGMQAHAPSEHALCVGNALRGQNHPAAPPGAGGKENRAWRQRFADASNSCGARVRGRSLSNFRGAGNGG